MKKLLLATGLLFAANAMGEVRTFKVDEDHTNIGFAVKHLMISKVTGRFNKFDGDFTYDTKTKTFKSMKATIDTASIDTNEPDRDKHLRSDDFFGVNPKEAKHINNKIVFEMTSYKPGKNGTGQAMGNITIKGITKPVTLTVEEGGFVKDPWGNERAAFAATGKINRKDFGLKWNKALETGGFVVGDEVELKVEVEGLLQGKTM